MRILLVVDTPEYWPISLAGVEVVAAQRYLTDAAFNDRLNVRVFNLCRSYSYQSNGYYVSLLAEARGHKPQPDIITIQDMKSSVISRVLMDDLDEYIQRALRRVPRDYFTLSIYFGRTVAKRDTHLGHRLHALFRCPLLRAQFVRKEKWTLQSIRPIPTSEIPESHRPTVVLAAKEYFARGQWSARRVRTARFDLAILVDPDEDSPPSDDRAIQKFIASAHRYNLSAEVIGREDISRLVEFDALFIRATTSVDHWTFRAARRAEAEGLAVIDDPLSISRCTNKVYLFHLLSLHDCPIPRTMIVHRDNIEESVKQLGLPCVVKRPDSSFSAGVMLAMNAADFHTKVRAALRDSDLLVAQEYMPTEFDWRVTLLDGEVLFVCRYFMARGHWQIRRRVPGGVDEGAVQALAIHETPRRVLAAAVKAARLIGDGLYGVDLKQVGNDVYVIEINDNPSIEAGYEDRLYRNEIYDRIVQSLIRRIERLRGGASRIVR
jgi:glutathione synthase/RimK-type ligase-like ATP-grasp enzyme